MLIDEVIQSFIQERSAVEVTYDLLHRSTLFHTDTLKNVPVIEATNVMEYLYMEDPKEKWSLHDVINFAPPFQRMWIEFNSPRKANAGNDVIEANFWNARKVATYIQSTPLKDGSWTMTIDILCKGMDNNVSIMGATDLRIDSNGIACFKYPVDKIPVMEDMPFFSISETMQNSKSISNILETIIVICGLTVSFMHVKNTSLLQQKYPEKLQRARIKRNKLPFIHYYVLEIHPLQKILRSEGKSSVEGIKKALYICRGHFKNYRDGRGLFGKYKGIYWWQEHLKGDHMEGIVIKDYKVNPE